MCAYNITGRPYEHMRGASAGHGGTTDHLNLNAFSNIWYDLFNCAVQQSRSLLLPLLILRRSALQTCIYGAHYALAMPRNGNGMCMVCALLL